MSTPQECRICYFEKQTFMDCGQCTKRICTDCFSKLSQMQCPYCRNPYLSSLDDEEEYDDNMPPLEAIPHLHRQHAYIRRRNEMSIQDRFEESVGEAMSDAAREMVSIYVDEYLSGELNQQDIMEVLQRARELEIN